MVPIQQQIYIISGVLGGVLFFVILALGGLFMLVKKLNDQINDNDSSHNNSSKPQPLRNTDYAYNTPEIHADEELKRRGYSRYEGPPSTQQQQQNNSFNNATSQYPNPRDRGQSAAPYNRPLSGGRNNPAFSNENRNDSPPFSAPNQDNAPFSNRNPSYRPPVQPKVDRGVNQYAPPQNDNFAPNRPPPGNYNQNRSNNPGPPRDLNEDGIFGGDNVFSVSANRNEDKTYFNNRAMNY